MLKVLHIIDSRSLLSQLAEGGVGVEDEDAKAIL